VRNEAIVAASLHSESGEAEDLRHGSQPIVEVEIRDSTDMTEAAVNQPGIEGESEQLEALKIILDADVAAPESSVAHILSRLEDWGLIGRRLTGKDDSYDEEDEKVIRSRLESLGYL
jgi:hypothetical protein